MRFSPARAAMLAAVLAEPDEEWTVAALQEAAQPEATTRDAVRELVLVLMNERLMEPVPYQRALTVRLRSGAETAVRLHLANWRRFTEMREAEQ